MQVIQRTVSTGRAKRLLLRPRCNGRTMLRYIIFKWCLSHLWTSAGEQCQWELTHPSGIVKCCGSSKGTVDWWTPLHSWTVFPHTPVLKIIIYLCHTCSYWLPQKKQLFNNMFQPHSLCSNNEIRMITVIGFQGGSLCTPNVLSFVCMKELRKLMENSSQVTAKN